jgi:hypothetical protein
VHDAADITVRIVPPLWLGMVLAISFLETPLKFRAPGITLELGLGIGRVVFHALNLVELVLAALLAVAYVGVDGVDHVACAALVVAAVALLAQVVVLRPALDARLARRIAGEELPRSAHHLVYIGLELLKVIALLVAAITIARGDW